MYDLAIDSGLTWLRVVSASATEPGLMNTASLNELRAYDASTTEPVATKAQTLVTAAYDGAD